MQFSIQREVLLKPLQQVVGVVERRQTLPVLGSSHGAMVTEEFRPRPAPIAITNVAPQRPSPIVINTRA